MPSANWLALASRPSLQNGMVEFNDALPSLLYVPVQLLAKRGCDA